VATITDTKQVAVGAFAPGHLGELTQQIPFEMVDEALAATGTTQVRVRHLPARVVVYLLLAGCLFTELGYEQVWAKLTAGLAGVQTAHPTASALSKARHRLGSKPLRWLFDLLAGPAAVATSVGVRWRGLLVCAIDGTTLTAPNLKTYHKQPGNHGGTGYPQLRLLTLVACGTRSIIQAVFGPARGPGNGETSYAWTARQHECRHGRTTGPQLRRRQAAGSHRRHRSPLPGTNQRQTPPTRAQALP
jgi:hypothetical protein